MERESSRDELIMSGKLSTFGGRDHSFGGFRESL